MKYRPLISGPSAPWVDDEDLPDDCGTVTIDAIASILADHLSRRAETLRRRADWTLLHEEIRAEMAGASVRNNFLEITELNDLFLELLNLTTVQEKQAPSPAVPSPLPWDENPE